MSGLIPSGPFTLGVFASRLWDLEEYNDGDSDKRVVLVSNWNLVSHTSSLELITSYRQDRDCRWPKTARQRSFEMAGLRVQISNGGMEAR